MCFVDGNMILYSTKALYLMHGSIVFDCEQTLDDRKNTVINLVLAKQARMEGQEARRIFKKKSTWYNEHFTALLTKNDTLL